jgi:phosphosulfolactate phosphohydrolase-like enzyme
MGVSCYIVLDKEDVDFDSFVNGKAVAKAAEDLADVCAKLGLPPLDDFLAMSANDIEDLLDEDVDIPVLGETWFTPDEGLKLIGAVFRHLQANPKDVKDPHGVLEDLAEYSQVLTRAKAVDAKWRFHLDL